MIISVYIDDCPLIAHRDNMSTLKHVLSDRFEVKDLGPVTSILGIEVIRNETAGYLCLRQRGHILSALDTFNMNDCLPARTPLPAGLQLAKIDVTPDDCKSLPYRSAIGKLLYIALASRPDIAFAVTYLCRFSNAFDKSHWDAVKHVLRYLKGSIDQVIRYERQESDVSTLAPSAFCDADFAGDINTRKSISAYVFLFAGGPVSWNASFQKVVSLSSTEAEYVALTHATKQAIFARKLLAPLGLDHESLTTIYCDSQSAIAIANSASHDNRPRLKHFDVKVHFIRDMVIKGDVRLAYCPTADMIADYLTKALPRPAFEHLKHATGLLDADSST